MGESWSNFSKSKVSGKTGKPQATSFRKRRSQTSGGDPRPPQSIGCCYSPQSKNRRHIPQGLYRRPAETKEVTSGAKRQLGEILPSPFFRHLPCRHSRSLYAGIQPLDIGEKRLFNSACEDFHSGSPPSRVTCRIQQWFLPGTGVAPRGANRQEFHPTHA